jgi:hypothetical protein
MIKPTPGRIVWFTPSTSDDTRSDKSQPLAAIVAYVWNDRLINLSVIDQHGMHHPRTSVQLLQDEDVGNEGGYFAQWMPYQKGQSPAADTQKLPGSYAPSQPQSIHTEINIEDNRS